MADSDCAGGIREEARQTLMNVHTTLEAYGLKLGDVAECTIMLADIGEWQMCSMSAMTGMLCALSTAFYSMDGQWPAVLVALGGNALRLSGCALFYFGSQRFYGVPCTWKWWLALGIGCLTGITWFLLVHPDYRIRVLLLTTVRAAICLTHARLTWQHGRGFAPHFMAVVLAFQGLVLLTRAATTLFQDAVGNRVRPEPVPWPLRCPLSAGSALPLSLRGRGGAPNWEGWTVAQSRRLDQGQV